MPTFFDWFMETPRIEKDDSGEYVETGMSVRDWLTDTIAMRKIEKEIDEENKKTLEDEKKKQKQQQLILLIFVALIIIIIYKYYLKK